MPLKNCPKGCGCKCGPRSLYCKRCGAPFVSTLKKFGHDVTNVVKPNQVVNNNINVVVGGQSVSRPTYKAEVPVFETYNDEINLDPTGYFDKMVDREAQLNIVLSAARTAIDSNFDITNSILLYGPPASGKSSFIKCFVDMVGRDNCYIIDATTSTQAGILTDLIERGPSVKFLVLNEIEKVKNPDDVRWLLGVLDERKEIRVNNSRIGNIQMPFKVLAIADCNDLAKLKNFSNGAIYSRFVNQVYCPRLTDESIFKAIQPYVRKINGNDEWIWPVINFVRSEYGTDDIRRMIAIVCDGRERCLTGEYFNILKATNIS